MNIGELITLRRNSWGLSVEQLAERVKVSPETVKTWERNNLSDMCYLHIIALSKALHIPAAIFMEDEISPSSVPNLHPTNIVPLFTNFPETGQASSSQPVPFCPTLDEARFLQAYRSADFGTRLLFEQKFRLYQQSHPDENDL